MLDQQTLAFAGLVAILTLTPGADTMMVIKNVLAHGRRGGLLTTFGVCTGLMVHASLSGLGLSLILVQSAAAFTVMKWVGAAYLVYLGARAIWTYFHEAHPEAALETGPATDAPAHRVFAQGFFSNVLNPKVAVFYLAFLPQFIAPGDPVLAKSLLLAGIHFVMGIAWLSTVTLAINVLRGWLTRPRVRAGLEAVSGLVLIGFGLRLALERR